ncbi:MAG: hypothetical protein J2P29_08430, partial [Actinobacteria bacterium]|nr:hypothetical protein [Actinomycetota bacterium]
MDDAADDDIMAAITSGGAGTVLMTKHFLPLLKASHLPVGNRLLASATIPCQGRSCRRRQVRRRADALTISGLSAVAVLSVMTARATTAANGSN